jgi:hypothetical protein
MIGALIGMFAAAARGVAVITNQMLRENGSVHLREDGSAMLRES